MNKLCMILPLALILCLMVGCQDKEAMAELEAMKVQAEVEEQNKETARDLFKAIDEGNAEKILALLADDFILTAPGITEPLGRDILVQLRNAHYESFPDWIHMIENVIADGDKVVVKLTQKGTHETEYEGIPASGAKATMLAMHLLRIVDGKIKEWFAIEDYLGLYMQLGMELRSAGNIQISHVTGLAGHDITVTVTTGGDERITHVRTVFDGRTIGNDSLKPPHLWYRREFVQQGGHSPGVKHTVFVEVTSTIGRETASSIWTDQ